MNVPFLRFGSHVEMEMLSRDLSYLVEVKDGLISLTPLQLCSQSCQLICRRLHFFFRLVDESFHDLACSSHDFLASLFLVPDEFILDVFDASVVETKLVLVLLGLSHGADFEIFQSKTVHWWQPWSR